MVNAINPFQALNTLGAAGSDAASFADDFGSFLNLLTTQLQNQNPLDPLDTNQFTQQLVQFTSVEQQIKMNDNLENLLALQAASAVNGAASYIGKTVEISGDESGFDGNAANWGISARGAGLATYTIKDEAGNIVFQDQRSLDQTTQNYGWDGRTTSGGTAPEGTYSLSVSAIDDGGNHIPVTISSSGRVDAIQFNNGLPFLSVNGQTISLDQILSISLSENQ